MANGWTLERRARQAKLIRRWRPWERSTGPRSAEGKARVSQSSYKGARRVVLRTLAKILRHQKSSAKRCCSLIFVGESEAADNDGRSGTSNASGIGRTGHK